MKKVTRITLATLMLIAAAGCTSISTSTNYDKEASFSNYRTFQLKSQSTLPAHLIRKIEQSITAELTHRGLTPAVQGELIVNYFTLVNDQTTVSERPEVTLLRYRRGYVVWNTYETEIRTTTDGTLIVDIVDADTDKLIWEGYVEGAVSRGDPDRTIRKITEGVNNLFKDLPMGVASSE